jgi:prophage regulatory protein
MPMLMLMARYLMGAREIEARLGVSRQRVQQLAARPDWPAPYDELAMGKVWRKEDVEAWIAEHRPDLSAADEVVTD